MQQFCTLVTKSRQKVFDRCLQAGEHQTQNQDMNIAWESETTAAYMGLMTFNVSFHTGMLNHLSYIELYHK